MANNMHFFVNFADENKIKTLLLLLIFIGNEGI